MIISFNSNDLFRIQIVSEHMPDKSHKYDFFEMGSKNERCSPHQENQNQSELYHELLNSSVSNKHVSNLDVPWMSAKQVRLHFFWGDRGAAKTTSMEQTAELYYNEGLNIWHLWGARSFENLFWAINMNCREKWKQEDSLPEEMKINLENRLHCNCHKAYPISWIVPNYTQIDKDSLDRFNGLNWKSIKEYRYAVSRGIIGPDISKEDRIKLHAGKLKKPDFLLPDKETIKVGYIPIPEGKEGRHSFDREFIKIILQARIEHRVVVMNPQIFLGDTDKFKVIGRIIELIPNIADEHFIELTEEQVGKMRGLDNPIPRSRWTKWELGWDKICLVMSELRTVAPNNKYSPQRGSTDSKRPIVDIIPELRHVRVWFMGDLQNPDDLNSSVRPQSDNVVIKKATRELLGNEWTWFFHKIDEKREKVFHRYSFIVKSKEDERFVPPEYVAIVNKICPRIEELPKNKGYVVFRNGEYFLETFDFPSFHHKTEEEKFVAITGIKWTTSKKKQEESEYDKKLRPNGKLTRKQKNDIRNMVLRRAVDHKNLGIDYNEVVKKLKDDVQNSLIPSTGLENKTGKYISNLINANLDLKSLLKK